MSQQEEKKAAGKAPAPPAFSSPINFASVPRQFGSETSSINTGFNFAAPSNTTDNALARLAHKEKELDDAKTSYHNLIVERDTRIEELEKTLKSVRTDLSNTRKAKEDVTRENYNYSETARVATEAKTKLETALKWQTDIATHDREVAEKLRKEETETYKTLKANNEIIRRFKERVSADKATIDHLHRQTDDLDALRDTLEAANGKLALQHEGITSEVSHATQEFEQMFQDLGRELDLNGYISHVRDLLSAGTLKRQDSSLSLQRQLSTQKSDQELPKITGTSLQDQLAAVDDASSEHSVPANGDEEDEDDTLTDLGLGRQWTEYDYFVRLQDQEKKISELKQLNEELVAKTQPDTLAATMTDNTTQTDELAATTMTDNITQTEELANATTDSTTQTDDLAIKTSDNTTQTDDLATTTTDSTTQTDVQIMTSNLGFSAIRSIAIPPTKPKWNLKSLKPSKIRTTAIQPVETPVPRPRVVRPQPTNMVRYETKPLISGKMAFYVLLSLYFFLFVSMLSEKYSLASANDLTRRNVIRMGGSGLAGLVAPVLTAMDDMFGANSALMG